MASKISRYQEKRRQGLVPYTYGTLKGVPPHKLGSTKYIQPPEWNGRFHRFVEPNKRWSQSRGD